jgi:hypothetical protein
LGSPAQPPSQLRRTQSLNFLPQFAIPSNPHNPDQLVIVIDPGPRPEQQQEQLEVVIHSLNENPPPPLPSAPSNPQDFATAQREYARMKGMSGKTASDFFNLLGVLSSMLVAMNDNKAYTGSAVFGVTGAFGVLVGGLYQATTNVWTSTKDIGSALQTVQGFSNGYSGIEGIPASLPVVANATQVVGIVSQVAWVVGEACNVLNQLNSYFRVNEGWFTQEQVIVLAQFVASLAKILGIIGVVSGGSSLFLLGQGLGALTGLISGLVNLHAKGYLSSINLSAITGYLPTFGAFSLASYATHPTSPSRPRDVADMV